MCTCPRLVRHEFQGFKFSEAVPCGKCHECIIKAQNEFAALAVLEAKRSKSMYFLTFTYDNRHCPVMVSRFDEDGLSSQEFLAGQERLEILPKMIRERIGRNGKLIKYLEEIHEDSASYVPSLERESVKLFLKRTRQAYKREYGYLPVFRYAGFGEYG